MIADLAARQHGVLSRRQLAALGLGRGAIDRRVASGRLHPVHRGVYAVGHPLVTTSGRWMAAVLACGREAFLSHRSAAALWGIAPPAEVRIDVTTARKRGRGRPGIALHRVRVVHRDDRATRRGIPLTALARTLLDLAEVCDERQLERAFEEAERLRLLDLRKIHALLDRSPGRRGRKPLRALLAKGQDPPATRSELERRFLELCRQAGLPPPTVNAVVAGIEVDAFWPRRRLIVELDGYAYHRTRSAFERDRVRDGALQLAGYRVLRVTWRRLDREAGAVLAAIRTLLAAGAP